MKRRGFLRALGAVPLAPAVLKDIDWERVATPAVEPVDNFSAVPDVVVRRAQPDDWTPDGPIMVNRLSDLPMNKEPGRLGMVLKDPEASHNGVWVFDGGGWVG